MDSSFYRMVYVLCTVMYSMYVRPSGSAQTSEPSESSNTCFWACFPTPYLGTSGQGNDKSSTRFGVSPSPPIPIPKNLQLRWPS